MVTSNARETAVRHTFEKGPEGWCSYDYHASILSGWREAFILSTWRPGEGPGGANCVTVDHHQWSADTPEDPVSILALIHYRGWVNGDPLDLREAQLSVYLRGDGLKTGDAACYFWVNTSMNRWHLASSPLRISDGCWAPGPNRLRLVSDESLWHNSWSGLPPRRKSLDSALSAAGSYGFAFVGFRAEVTGRLSMAGFEITGAGPGKPG